MSSKQSKQRSELLNKIEEEVWGLKSSPLFNYRTENNYVPVVGAGSSEAKIVFIGEAPGEKEAQTGQPFCGRAGKVLDLLFQQAGIERKDVYITSIVKDRPPKNRDPRPDEISLYGPFLDRQIEIIKPEVVATLGRFSMEYIMNKYGLGDKLDSISKIHGQVFQAENFKFIPLYHPAATIYNRKLLPELEKDFQQLLSI